jgi:hypothetical protein
VLETNYYLFICDVIPAKPGPGLNREPESMGIQEVGFLDAVSKSGMTENYGLSSEL